MQEEWTKDGKDKFISPKTTLTNTSIPASTLDTQKTIHLERMTSIPNVNLHENTYIGKAIFAINFESIGLEETAMGGINTIPAQPYNLMIKSDNKNATNTPTEMHLFNHINILFSATL